MKFNHLTRCVFLMLSMGMFPVVQAHAQEADSVALDAKNEALVEAVKTFNNHFEVHGYAQAGYDYDNGARTNSFDFKRTLFWMKAKITDRWSFLFMHDFNSVTQEFYTDYRFNKFLGVRFGQFKNSFSLENPISPAAIELINICSQSVTYLSGCGSDPLYGKQFGRDIGLLLYGELGNSGLRYELEVMNGQGINKKDGNSQKDVILKLDYHVIQPLRIVMSGQLGTGHAIAVSDANPTIKEGDNYKRNRISVGAEWRSFPVNVRAEYLKGWDGSVQSQGAYATASANLIRNVDAIASYDYFDRNTHLNMRQSNYTIGLQYWFFRKCRIQAQFTRCCPSFKKDFNSVQLQTQVCF